MNGKRLLVACVLAGVLSFAVVGCGGGNNADNEGSLVQSIVTATESSEVAAEASADSTATTGAAAEAATGAAAEASTEAETSAQSVEEMASAQVNQEAKTNIEVKDLVGKWININDSTRFANIAVDGGNFTYEDNDGKYTASLENGILKVKVGDNDFADVYIDLASGHLMLVYQDNTEEFAK